jgi:diphthamide synthase subunit DPH2
MAQQQILRKRQNQKSKILQKRTVGILLSFLWGIEC